MAEFGEWTETHAQLPTEADGDAQGCVIGWHIYNGAVITGWHQFRAGGMLTHWMPTPDKPKGGTDDDAGGD